jgi:hypothetical protein
MKVSKYFNIDPNILIEYIYDDSNLIGEPYNVLYNTRTGLKCFISADELRPAPRGYKQTNNDFYNQIYKIDTVQNRYGKIPLSNQPNQVDSNVASFLQVRNFARSIPVRYDIIKVHIPVDWTFGDYKGFYLRSYTYNFDNTKVVELSNYFFNMTDIEQNYKLEYSSPNLLINEKQWGKYIKIQIPSTTKVSDQRSLNVTRENSINFNLTDGLGLSKTAPVFLDFHFISSVDTVGGNKFFNLTSKKTVVVPQTPEFEKLGVRIEESSQGDFFLIYGTYNGTLGDFENFIDESYYEGNRYYVEYTIDLFEKNVKTKTTTFVVNEDFGEEIEYRPILKFTTTTAIIDVTMKLIDSVDGTFIERNASYGMLQGGGSKMGSEPNERLKTANGTGGAGDVSKYARNLSKINLRKAKRKEVFYIKSTVLPNTSNDAFGSKPILKLKSIPFNLFSSNYYIVNDDRNYIFDKISYIPNNKSLVYIFPFDNFIKLKIIETDGGVNELPIDLNKLQNLKLTIKSDKKDLNFDIYKDSSENKFEEGIVVFKIPESSYQDIKKISSSGYDVFYINGIDEFGVKKIIYNSFFLPWDSATNMNKMMSDYDSKQIKLSEPVVQPVKPDVTQSVKDAIDSGTNIPKGVNTNAVSNSDNQEIKKGSGLSGASFMFNPRWKASQKAIEIGLNPNNNFKLPQNMREFKILLFTVPSLGLKPETKESMLNKTKNLVKSLTGKSNVSLLKKDISDINNRKIDLILGYFKGLNVDPFDGIRNWFTPELEVKPILKRARVNPDFEDLSKDLLEYINSGLLNKRVKWGIGLKYQEITIGEFIPKSKKDKDLIKSNKIIQQNPPKTKLKSQIPPPPPPNSDTNYYSPNSDIPRGGKK